MEKIEYINRITGKREVEKVYGAEALRILYGTPYGSIFKYLSSRFSCVSSFYGFLQSRSLSRKKIIPFIQQYHVDASEFLNPVDSFQSFNDFFIRKLKPQARPIFPGDDVAIIPADGRYLFYQDIEKADGFIVKGKKFSLRDLLQDAALAEEYRNGTMIIARLCPSDYHRFHFPCACTPGESRIINGFLYSVNPIAVKKNIAILTENKRSLCVLHTKEFGQVLYLEVGATNVGSINQTYTPDQPQSKGAEKGFFAFGGSALILLFRANTIQLDPDLTLHPHVEIKCLMGQSLGIKASSS